MVLRSKIIDFIDDYLEISKIEDPWMKNGLQVEGKKEVNKIVTGVSANLEFFRKAAEAKADLILVHHGFFSGKELFNLTGFLKERVKFLLDRNINLGVYHLPLDQHKIIGNAALILQKLGLKPEVLLDFGWGSKFSKEVDFDDFLARMENKLGIKAQTIFKNKDKVKTVGVIAGSGANDLVPSVLKGVDTFITGESKEPTPAIAKELEVNFIALGHYQSEIFGIKALGEMAAKKFKVEQEFADVRY